MVEQPQERETVKWKQPSHPSLILVEKAKAGTFGTCAKSLVSLPAGAFFCDLSTSRQAAKRTYATVQASETTDVDLNSDVVYFNHSCRPSMVIDPAKGEVRVGDRPLREGDELTFFYPSFEWSMSQPFECVCNQDGCLGLVQGAEALNVKVLRKYWLADHIRRLSGIVATNGTD